MVLPRCAVDNGGVGLTDCTAELRAISLSDTHDCLTGLANRTLLFDRIVGAVTCSPQRSRDVAVVFCDLDRFAVVNESMGYAVGDQVLKEVAARLEGAVGARDTVARLAGKKFVACCLGVRGTHEAERVGSRVIRAMAQPFTVNEHELFVTASVGIRLAIRPIGRVEDLVRDASVAMRDAKRAGGACYRVFDHSIIGPGSYESASTATSISCST